MTVITIELVIAALISGAIVGLFLSVFGGGGSVLAAPLLLYFVGVSDPHVAIGTSAGVVAAGALFGLVGHWRAHRVKWPCASVFALSGLVGAWAGSSIAKAIDGDVLLAAFAGVMAIIGLSMLRPRQSAGDPDVHITPAFVIRLVPLGVIVGLAAGFFGIGGGFLIVPGLIAATGMTMSAATASSLVSVAIFGFATSANYALGGYFDLKIFGLVLTGALIGTLTGLALSGKLAGRQNFLRRAFALLVLIVAAYIGWQAFAALQVSA